MTNPRLVAIKSIHTLIFLFMSACIVYVLYAGLTRTYDATLIVALAAVIVETAVYLLNGRRCPLTAMAKRYGDQTGNDWIADIFLPAWLAPYIPPVCGGLFVAGLLALVINWLLAAL